jgi:transcriptional regulator with PAS, ATPase and Fis domain
MRGPETHNVDRYLSVQLSPIHDTEGNPSGILIIVHPTKQTLEGHSPRTGHVARYVFEDIVGSSSPIREVIRWAKIASKHSFTILLEGETGSGKEILAHAIHNNSLRSRGPFVAINCSAIPKDLVESELFGYIGGAFTGSRKEGGKGKLEIAHRGTLLLDEVDSLPLETQAKLLRFLESGEIIRVGDTKLSNVDVRVIACTSVNLDEQVQRGTFRKDLYYRLNVFKIEIPPLRKRKEDILLLANSILNNLVGEKPGLSSELHPRVSELLLAHDWPGNVRELRNCLKHAVAMASKGEILPEDLPASLHKNVGLSADSHQDENPFVTMERELLACALTEGHGNPEEAARLLGVSRATMYRKIKKYDLLQKKSIPS